MSKLNPPLDDQAYHARISDIVTSHLAMNGSLRPTAFVQVDHDERIVVIDAMDVEDPALFIDVVRRTSCRLESPRTAIASECVMVSSDDPVEMAAIHHAVSEDPSLLETHPLMRRGVTIQVESDEGLTTSFHEIARHHPEMAEILPSETTFQPVPEAMRGGLNGFHVPAEARDGDDMAEVMARVGHVGIPEADATEPPKAY